jgi:hypothetical protein
MYLNVKMIPVVTIPGIEGRRIKERLDGVNSSMIYLIHCKNFSKCHNIPLPSTIKKIAKQSLSGICSNADRQD